MSNLTQILQRDEKGKPILKLTPLEKTAVHTPTKKSYDELMEVYECGGGIWRSGNLPTESDCFRGERKETCVDAGVDYQNEGIYNNGKFGYSSRKFYQGKNWKIISPQKFYEIQKITPEMLNEMFFPMELI